MVRAKLAPVDLFRASSFGGFVRSSCNTEEMRYDILTLFVVYIIHIYHDIGPSTFAQQKNTHLKIIAEKADLQESLHE